MFGIDVSPAPSAGYMVPIVLEKWVPAPPTPVKGEGGAMEAVAGAAGGGDQSIHPGRWGQIWLRAVEWCWSTINGS